MHAWLGALRQHPQESPSPGPHPTQAPTASRPTAPPAPPAGLQDLGPVSILPLATGMAMTSTLLAIKARRPASATHVLWSRIDQKTCLKAITAAGLTPVVVPLARHGDQLATDAAALRALVSELGSETIACVVTTTSCFAPRAADDVVAVAKLCAAEGLPHMINNAYGVQSSALCGLITSAWRKGRVDAVVQSTDKNFMVPVGGAIVAAPASRPQVVHDVNSSYPGRASGAAHVDLMMTLLHWGAAGWRTLLRQREELLPVLRAALEEVAAQQGERVLVTPSNPISLALTLDSLQLPAGVLQQHGGQVPQGGEEEVVSMQQRVQPGEARLAESAAEHAQQVSSQQQEPQHGSGQQQGEQQDKQGQQEAQQQQGEQNDKQLQAGRQAPDVTFFGSMLWSRNISGTRVVPRGKAAAVAGLQFAGYGSHCDDYPHVYVTAAAAVGTTVEEVQELAVRLNKCFAEFRKKQAAALAVRS
jgi:hypothetical protein